MKVLEHFIPTTDAEGNVTAPINRPEWMVLNVVPVIPPELRPLVPLGRRPLRDVGPQRSVPPRH